MLAWVNCFKTCQSLAFIGNEISFRTFAGQRTINWQDVKEVRLYKRAQVTAFRTAYGSFSAPMTFARRAELVQFVENKAAEMAVPIIGKR